MNLASVRRFTERDRAPPHPTVLLSDASNSAEVDCFVLQSRSALKERKEIELELNQTIYNCIGYNSIQKVGRIEIDIKR